MIELETQPGAARHPAAAGSRERWKTMSSQLSAENARRLQIALLAIDAAKDALSVLTKPTSTDPLLAEIAKDMVTSVAGVTEKLSTLAKVTDTDLPLTGLPEYEDRGEYRNVRMTLLTLLATIDDH